MGRKDLFSHSLGHDKIIVTFPSIDRFFPSGCAETPLAAWFKADAAQIIASRCREIEKLACEDACVVLLNYLSQKLWEEGEKGGGCRF